ncbi:MAG: hypothetical protein MZV70_60665 [Desulfobacterales bacterium]|nr:hypothetical protein [Desulfobacterales bacterium]
MHRCDRGRAYRLSRSSRVNDTIEEVTMAYTCKNCGAVANEPGHLCNPCGDKAKCSFCGSPGCGPASTSARTSSRP